MIPEYFISFDTNLFPIEETDFLIVGGGISGLRASIEIKSSKVLLIYKNGLNETSTYNAQGGIAVGINETDSPTKHFNDTLKAGSGINNEEAVKILVNEGIDRVKELIDWGFSFDKNNDKYHFTKEGGHSCNRILHADGDSTGKKVAEFLYQKVSSYPNIKILHNYFLIDLISVENKIVGAILLDTLKNSILIIKTKAIVLASGGAGQIFQETTNPSSLTGDGHISAFRKGAELMDLEFFQFHPTTFYLAGAPRFLISEAVRGEGGILKNSYGDRFMSDYHPLKELAPRDIVTKAIIDQMKKTNTNCVYLDLSHFSLSFIKERFPTIYEFCKKYKINLPKDLIPVRPSAHYFMGGIKIDLWGKTNLKNLYACGEVACNGLHGANRLASNSLLEGLVFGARVGKVIQEDKREKNNFFNFKYKFPQKADILIDKDDLKRSIKSLMWRNVGIERDEESLKYALEKLNSWEKYAFLKEFRERAGFESQNMLVLAKLITHSSLLRQESRGTHYRTDYPKTDDKNWKKHIVVNKNNINEI